MRGSLILALALVPLASCSFEEASPGVRGQCGAANGEPLCPADVIENGEDACWKLVECNSIPIVSPEGVDLFDFAFCERVFQSFSEHRYNISLACVAASTCDQLRFVDANGNPTNSPARNVGRRPICLEYGDRQ